MAGEIPFDSTHCARIHQVAVIDRGASQEVGQPLKHPVTQFAARVCDA